MSTSPTQRSLEHLRKNGWQACVVEKWIPQAKRRVDAYGFGDLLACRQIWAEHQFTRDVECIGTEIALIQSTTASNLAARRMKIRESHEAREWLRCGGVIILHGWKKPTKTKPRWDLREERVELSDGE